MIKDFNIFNKTFFIEIDNGDFDQNILLLECRNIVCKTVQKNINLSDYNPPFATFCINLSNSCNLKCDYCFNNKKDGKSIDYQTIIKYLDYLFCKFPKKEKYFIDLSGNGEPLLFLKSILKIKKYCDSVSDIINKEIVVSFVSNGTLLSKRIVSILQKNGIIFGVSIDGNLAIHNKHRKNVNNTDTYNTIINNVKRIKNKDFLGVAVTLTNDTFSLVDSMKELIYYFPTISFKPVRSSSFFPSKLDISLWEKEYKKLTIFLINEIKQNNYKYIYALLNGDDYFGKFIKRIFLRQRFITRCDAGLNRFALSIDKNIYICSPSSYIEEYSFGCLDITTEKMQEILNKQAGNKICNFCDYRLICGGECLVELYYTGHTNNHICKFKKLLIQLAIYLYYELSEKEIKTIKSFIEKTIMRYYQDPKLTSFLKSNNYSFTKGKKIYDSLKK